MSELTARQIASKLTLERFKHAVPDVKSLSDPLVDTPMIVTLDELRPYDLNPRVTRNPLYDEIKASIRERGLEAPPPITRRPGETHFIIRNGGNTRLAVLRELWSETREERFFRIPCLFRPWSPRGEIVALTGHLAENELHGALSFIERALGVEKARELYEAESGKPLTQTELARRLTADGYPITQQHISRMQDAVRYLLPAIPSVLYAGLGKPQIERLAALRKAAARSWERHATGKSLSRDFAALFQEVLALFDSQPDAFNVQRVQDELVGQLSELLGVDYDELALEFVDTEIRQRALAEESPSSIARDMSTHVAQDGPQAESGRIDRSRTDRGTSPRVSSSSQRGRSAPQGTSRQKSATQPLSARTLVGTDRSLTEKAESPSAGVCHSLANEPHSPPEAALTEATMGTPGQLRALIETLRQEIAQEADVTALIEAVLRLSDAAILKLFRLIQLSRRLQEWESSSRPRAEPLA